LFYLKSKPVVSFFSGGWYQFRPSLKDEVLNQGFEMVALARALFKDTDFVNKIRREDLSHSACDICNYCIAVMYTHEATCIQNMENPDPAILNMLKQS